MNLDMENQEQILPPNEDAEQLDIIAARLLRRFKRLLHIERPFQVAGYHSFSGPNGTYVAGRMMESLKESSLTKDSPWWDNALDLLRRFTRAKAPGVKIRINFGSFVWEGSSGGTGYFTVHLNQSIASQKASIELLDIPKEFDFVNSQEKIPLTIIDKQTPFILISDVDDTIIESNANDFFRSIFLAFTNNASTRRAVSGMAELYSSLRDGKLHHHKSPPPAFFYVTSSGWSLYEMLRDVLKERGFPGGPMLMQRLGLKQNKIINKGHHHKLDKIKMILELCPDIPILLIGDSGQHDRSIYSQAHKLYPDRIKGIFIRILKENQAFELPRKNTLVQGFSSAEELEGQIKKCISDFIPS